MATLRGAARDKFYALASHDGVHGKVSEEPITVDFPEKFDVGMVVASSSERRESAAFNPAALPSVSNRRLASYNSSAIGLPYGSTLMGRPRWSGNDVLS
jgi:hypothetical protein